MQKLEREVREAAERLHSAIAAAEAAGMRVVWPHRAADLLAIGVSDTARSLAARDAAPEKPRGKRKAKSAPPADVGFASEFAGNE